MRRVASPSDPLSKGMALAGLLAGLLMCGEHHCPMIVVQIRGEAHHAGVLEHVDSHLGGKRVRGVVRRALGDTAVCCVQFADGHLWPLYCPCCGEPLGVRDRAQFRRTIVGAYLLTLADAPAAGPDPECLVCAFSTDAQGRLVETRFAQLNLVQDQIWQVLGLPQPAVLLAWREPI